MNLLIKYNLWNVDNCSTHYRNNYFRTVQLRKNIYFVKTVCDAL